MRRMIVGLAAAMAVSLGGAALAEDQTEEIQDEEQPGSEIELDIGGGKAMLERKSGASVFRPGDAPQMAPGPESDLEVPNDPDTPQAGDRIDDELPGEGPENLSGPDDDDDLPD